MTSIINYINSINNNLPYFESKETNHLPMTLYALSQINASEGDLKCFTKHYTDNHVIVPSKTITLIVDRSNWKDYLGERSTYVAYQSFFRKEVSDLGIAKTLENYFEELVGGLASEAFHCLIEISYGIESRNANEVINGLAYLCSCHFAIPRFEIEKDYCDINNFISNIQKRTWYGYRKYSNDTISQDLIAVFNSDEFKNTMQFPNFELPATTSSLENAILETHLKKWNFISLHLVTSFHALEIIKPYIKHTVELYKFYWTAFIACVYSFNDAPNHQFPLFQVQEFDWFEVFSKAINSKDEHVIKLVYSCCERFKEKQNPLYQTIAKQVADSGLYIRI